ncbi:MAG: DUF2971 domain-containing protein [Candidatus Scalindua sp.]
MSKSEWFFHYTTAQGLFGILKEKKVWATDVNYMNDYEEIRKGIIYAQLWFEQNQQKINNKMGVEHTNIIKRNLQDEPGRQSGQRMFICSFSTEEDSLSQWRGYGGKVGYAIGFHQEYLEKKAKEIGLVFVKCIYKHDKDKNPVHEALDKLMATGHFDSKPPANSKLTDWLVTVLNTVKRNSVALKGEGFKDEREWRLYLGPDRPKHPEISDECFRVQNGIVTPYIKYPLFPQTIKESFIMTSEKKRSPLIRFKIGPTHHKDITYDGLNRLLLTYQNNFLYSRPEHSLVTYRNINE